MLIVHDRWKLNEYKQKHGDCNSPQSWAEDYLGLGGWVMIMYIVYSMRARKGWVKGAAARFGVTGCIIMRSGESSSGGIQSGKRRRSMEVEYMWPSMIVFTPRCSRDGMARGLTREGGASLCL